jgi:uncharacterized membrane protein YphA (DoxX/SURF4 family)
MHTLNLLLQAISAVAFFVYGIGCFYSASLISEFERYGLKALRKLIGALEIAGALGLFIGFYLPILRFLSAGGLSMLMFFAIIVRWKIKDPILQWIPAIVLFLINLSIALIPS